MGESGIEADGRPPFDPKMADGYEVDMSFINGDFFYSIAVVGVDNPPAAYDEFIHSFRLKP
ncbi:MAG: hypothetical protein QOF20_1340 [Acidimicrobiaceae bacterium]|jgi:hypothetical protein|nr:hypothetical protein [Acidimicrobiaceae bacterium]MDQ1368987.1 hypothetical protein [Acidimicrobiaceae bacterium]MDQ1415023.1 hypothetical protein [Acidimicrobiaceae bacterium]